MKRLILAALIVAAGTSVFCALQSATARFRKEFAARREGWIVQTQLLEQARAQRTELTRRIRELKASRLNPPPTAAKTELTDWIATNRSNALSSELRERLLAELGFDWNSMTDDLVVSKDTLRKVGVEAMRGIKLTDTARGILAITPEERAGLEGLAKQLAAEFNTWAVSHVERAEPEGNVLAKYTMAPDPEFSQSLSNIFCAGVVAALGAERGELLLGYAGSWMADLGMCGGTSSMTIKRSGDKRLGLELKTADGGTMFTDVTPYQAFPAAFRPIFPGGWTELALRESFELPQEFQKKDGGKTPDPER